MTRDSWFAHLARWLVYLLTLPLWIVAVLAYPVGVVCRCIVAMFAIGWLDGDAFGDWLFNHEDEA